MGEQAEGGELKSLVGWPWGSLLVVGRSMSTWLWFVADLGSSGSTCKANVIQHFLLARIPGDSGAQDQSQGGTWVVRGDGSVHASEGTPGGDEFGSPILSLQLTLGSEGFLPM